jgi:hypothetical protein
MVDGESGRLSQALDWAWDNKGWIAAKLAELKTWIWTPAEEGPANRLLIVGAGGVGKTTAAKYLAGEAEALSECLGEYQESIRVETYSLKDDPSVELVVPPGQRHRRDSTWSEIQTAIGAGEYHGIVLVNSFGYHSLGEISYKHHRLYNGNDSEFMPAFVRENQKEELAIVKRLASHLKTNTRKCWLLSLVTKQDLWWDRNPEVEDYYRDGAYSRQFKSIVEQIGKQYFRHEIVLCSQTIGNFKTGMGEILAETVAGYDHGMQLDSLRRFWETLDALKTWEDG